MATKEMLGQEVEFLDLDGSPAGSEISGREAEATLANFDKAPASADDIEIEDEDQTSVEIVEGGDTPDDAAEDGEEDEYEEDGEEVEDDGDDVNADTSEDDLKGYDPKVQKRIMRERQLKQDAVAQVEEANKRLAAMEGQYRELQKTQSLTAESAYSLLDKTSELELSNARAALITAKEDGDTSKEVEAQMEVNRLARIREQVKENKGMFVSDPTKADAKAEAPAVEQPTAQPENTGLTDEGNRWVAENASWLFNPSEQRAEVVAYLQQLDGQIAGDPNSPEYFNAVNRKLKARFPSLNPKPSRPALKKKKKQLKNKKETVSGVSHGSSKTNTSGKKKVTITAADKQAMRAFNLDPNDKAVVREWALNKLENI
jgi:hypothetical protein